MHPNLAPRLCRFINLSGFCIFSAFKNIQKTKNLSFFCCSTCTIFVYFFQALPRTPLEG